LDINFFGLFNTKFLNLGSYHVPSAHVNITHIFIDCLINNTKLLSKSNKKKILLDSISQGKNENSIIGGPHFKNSQYGFWDESRET
jgi:hypothetical protein